MVDIKTLIKVFFFFIYYPFIKGNVDFYRLIKNIQIKLPPSGSKCEVFDSKNMPEPFKRFTCINTHNFKTDRPQHKFDEIQKSLEIFKCWKTTIFYKRIQSYKKNLIEKIKSFKVESKNDVQNNLNFGVFQELIEGDASKNTPYIFSNYTIRYIKIRFNYLYKSQGKFDFNILILNLVLLCNFILLITMFLSL